MAKIRWHKAWRKARESRSWAWAGSQYGLAALESIADACLTARENGRYRGVWPGVSL
jgi:hypothetical protein